MKKIAITFLLLFFIFSTNTVYSQCTEDKNSEIAKYIQLTKIRDPQGCSQCGLLALYFCSAKYISNTEDQSRVSNIIEECKKNLIQIGEPYCCPDYLIKQPEWGFLADNSSTSNLNNSVPLITDNKIEKKTGMIQNILDLNSAVLSEQKIAFNLYENSDISPNLNTKEQIENDYNTKVKAINESAIQHNNRSNVITKAALQPGITGISDSNILNGISSAVNYIHSLEAESARKKALDMLKYKKKLALERIELEKQREGLLKERYDNEEKQISIESTRKINEFKAFGHNLNITLQEAKLIYRDFFKKSLKPIMTVHGNEIKTKPKKSKEPLAGKPYAFYVKNNMIVGHKIYVDFFPFDTNYKKGFEITLAKIDDLQKQFGFPPVPSESRDETGMEKSNIYTWQAGNKIVEVELVQFDIMGFHSSDIFINVYN